MADVQTVAAEIELLHGYTRRLTGGKLRPCSAAMHANVDWPNGMEGGRVLGTAAVRDYWKTSVRSCLIRTSSRRTSRRKRTDGSRSTCIRSFTTKPESCWSDQMIQHVYEIRDGLIQSMEIRET